VTLVADATEQKVHALQPGAGPVLFVCGFFLWAYAIARVFWPYAQPPYGTIGYILMTQPCGTRPQAKWLALKAYGPNRRDERPEFITDAVTKYSPRICLVGGKTPTSAVENSKRTQSVVSDEHSIYAQTPPSDLDGYILLTQACRIRGYAQPRWLAIKAYENNSENQGDTFSDDVVVYWVQICSLDNTTPDRAAATSELNR
jgi:hypothetical protein